jgi:hypothetical protein
MVISTADQITDEHYPGSRKKRRGKTEPPPLQPAPEKKWETSGKVLIYRGQATEFFHRGALAMALNRTMVAIRAMVTKKIIPNPRLQDEAGRYLYTRDQIEDMIALAIEEGVYDPRLTRRFSPRFVEEAHRILLRSPS